MLLGHSKRPVLGGVSSSVLTTPIVEEVQSWSFTIEVVVGSKGYEGGCGVEYPLTVEYLSREGTG